MSIEWMNHVWNNSTHQGTRLLMMLAIADYANENGGAFPSVETLAERTRQTKRNAIRILEKLLSSDELECDKYGSPYGTNLYRLTVATTPRTKRKASRRSGDISGPESHQSGDILGGSGDISGPESHLIHHDPPSTTMDPPKNPGADAPNGNGRKLSANNLAVQHLEEVFSEVTGVPVPENGNKKARGEWHAPMQEILTTHCKSDVTLADRVVREAIAHLQKELRFTPHAPVSIRKTAITTAVRLVKANGQSAATPLNPTEEAWVEYLRLNPGASMPTGIQLSERALRVLSERRLAKGS